MHIPNTCSRGNFLLRELFYILCHCFHQFNSLSKSQSSQQATFVGCSLHMHGISTQSTVACLTFDSFEMKPRLPSNLRVHGWSAHGIVHCGSAFQHLLTLVQVNCTMSILGCMRLVLGVELHVSFTLGKTCNCRHSSLVPSPMPSFSSIAVRKSGEGLVQFLTCVLDKWQNFQNEDATFACY